MAQVIYADEELFRPVEVELDERYEAEADRLKDERKELLDERRKLKRDQIELEKQLSEYAIKKQLDEKMMSSQKELFQKKFKILEMEFTLLGYHYYYQAEIKRLTKNYLIYEYDDPEGNHWRIEMGSRAGY